MSQRYAFVYRVGHIIIFCVDVTERNACKQQPGNIWDSTFYYTVCQVHLSVPEAKDGSSENNFGFLVIVFFDSSCVCTFGLANVNGFHRR